MKALTEKMRCFFMVKCHSNRAGIYAIVNAADDIPALQHNGYDKALVVLTFLSLLIAADAKNRK